jgi:hypothetical protein
MLQRALLFLCLAAPVAAGAQNTLTFTSDPAPPYGRTDCNNQSTLSVQLGWTLTPTGGTLGTQDTYRITATTADTECPTTTTGTTNLVASRLTSLGTTYTTTLGAILTAAAATTCTGDADVTIYVCVALARNSATTTEVSARNTFKLQFKAPLAPTGLVVTPGNNALNISWTAPDSTNDPAAETYRVTVVSTDPRDTTTHGSTIGGTSLRVDGLVNGVLYTVSVVAISEGGNESPAISKTESPVPVDDFFTHYQGEGGLEEGGCAGGPAGLLSLLALGALVRVFRRRS